MKVTLKIYKGMINIMTPGYKTSEFLVHLGVIVASWTTAILALLGQLSGVIPAKDNQWVVIATMVLTAIQAMSYSLSRTSLKTQALKTQEAQATLAMARQLAKAA